MSKTLEKLQNSASLILDLAKSYQATQAAVSMGIEDGFSVSINDGKVDTVEYEANNAVDITVYFGHQKAQVSTSDLSESNLKIVVEKACNMAKFTASDPFNGLADAQFMCKTPKNLDLYHPWELTPEQAIDLALQCEAFGLSEDKRIKQAEDVSISTLRNYFCYANTQGFMGCVPSTKHGINASFIAEEEGQMERDYGYTVARDAQDLNSIQEVAKETAIRTVRRLSPQKIATQKIPIIFESQVAGSLIAAFLSAIAGSAIYRKASFLLDQLDKSIFPDFINIQESPHLLKGLYSAPFDTEGVETYSKYFVQDGVLLDYILNSYSARKLNRQTTANSGGIFNVLVSTGDLNLKQLIQKMDKGLLVTELIGDGTNLVTGDYSRGAFGLWIEHGQIQYPVSEFTIAGNLKDMYRQIISIGNDADMRRNIQTGSILIEEMMIAGT